MPSNLGPSHSWYGTSLEPGLRLPRTGGEQRADEPSDLGDLWPDLRDELTDDLAQLLSTFAYVIATASDDLYLDSSPAESAVLNHAVNDAIALIARVVDCDGRSGARAARALFEHLVNFRDVTNSKRMAERYLRHAHVTEDLISRRKLYVEGLREPYRRKQKRRMRALGASAREPLARALEDFGSSFRRGFAEQDLKSRAQTHHLKDDYDGYKLLSGVMHGSSGGLYGTKATVEEAVVYRTGPNLKLASLAYIEGLTWFLQIVQSLPPKPRTRRFDLLVDTLQTLIHEWTSVDTALQGLDRRLWPATPPTGLLTVLALYPKGERWFLWDTRRQVIAVAEPPTGNWVEQVVSAARKQYRAYVPKEFGGRPMTTVVLQTHVVVKQDAKWVPAASIMVAPDFGEVVPESLRVCRDCK